MILDLYGVPFHAIIVFGHDHEFLFNPAWAYCGHKLNFWCMTDVLNILKIVDMYVTCRMKMLYTSTVQCNGRELLFLSLAYFEQKRRTLSLGIRKKVATD